MNYTELRVKEVTGTPSFAFHILAKPSLDVVAKNSESRLKVQWEETNYISTKFYVVSMHE